MRIPVLYWALSLSLSLPHTHTHTHDYLTRNIYIPLSLSSLSLSRSLTLSHSLSLSLAFSNSLTRIYRATSGSATSSSSQHIYMCWDPKHIGLFPLRPAYMNNTYTHTYISDDVHTHTHTWVCKYYCDVHSKCAGLNFVVSNISFIQINRNFYKFCHETIAYHPRK